MPDVKVLRPKSLHDIEENSEPDSEGPLTTDF